MNSAFGMEIVAETSASEAEQLVPAADTAHFSANWVGQLGIYIYKQKKALAISLIARNIIIRSQYHYSLAISLFARNIFNRSQYHYSLAYFYFA